MFVNRVKKTFRLSFAATAVASVLLVAAASGASAQSNTISSGVLSDLQPTTAAPTDGATAQVTPTATATTSTAASLSVTGLNTASAGTTLGAHIHVGPCVAGDGAAAGPHYNSTGQPATAVRNTTEIWFDFVVAADGTGAAQTTVPFAIPASGAQSLVIHEKATAPDGAAGARLACLPVTLVAPAPVVAAPAAATELAITGVQPTVLTIAGFSLVAFGGLAVIFARRKPLVS